MTTKSIYEIQTDYLNLFEKVEESLSNPELTSAELQKLESELEKTLKIRQPIMLNLSSH